MLLKIVIGLFLGVVILAMSLAALMAERTDRELIEFQKELDWERRRLDRKEAEIEPDPVT